MGGKVTPEYMRAWRQRHPGYWKSYPKRSKEENARLQRQWRERYPRKNLIILARARAKKRGFPCTITTSDIEWVTHCPVFELELDYSTTPTGQRKTAKRDNFATLDRKNPALGYVPGNVFVLSYKANRLKQDATVAQL